MALFATVQDVIARTGAIGKAWGPTSTPSTDDVEIFIQNVSDEITDIIEGLGLSVPDPGSDAAKALVSLAADGAAILALEAAFPDADGPSSPPALYDRIQKRFASAYQLLIADKLPALTLLRSSSGAPTASSFWADEPQYGYPQIRGLPWPPLDPAYPTEQDRNPALAPAFRKGQSA